METSPPPSPQRRPARDRGADAGGNLQIRVVPYSPPRLSSDVGSPTTSSRPVSYIDDDDADGYGYGYGRPERQDAWVKGAPPDALLSSSPGFTPGSTPNTRRIDPGNDALNATTLDCPAVPAASPGAEAPPSASSSPSFSPGSGRRPRRVIAVHSDKTFSLVPLRHVSSDSSSVTESARSPRLSALTTNTATSASSSYGRVSSGVFTDDRPGSRMVSLDDVTIPPSSPTTSTSSSPWNYRVVGDLRKVSKASHSRDDDSDSGPPSSPIPTQPPALPAADQPQRAATSTLTTKTSFQSSQSDSTLSDRTNYKVYGQSSPVAAAYHTTTDVDTLPPSSSHSNYQILAESSSSNPSIYDQPRPETGDSDANYIVHDGPAASTSSLIATDPRLRSEYSRESLVVAPLRPVKKRSFDHAGPYLSRSRESLRTGSLTSLSNILTQEATRALFAGPASIYVPGAIRRQGTVALSQSSASNTLQMTDSHPHQWSSQLSTVMSESEPGSDPPSRSLSPTTSVPARRGSGFNSLHSRRMLSISSSLAGLDDPSPLPTHSPQGSVEIPPPAFIRTASRDPGTGNLRPIRDHDEDGDGLADLEGLQPPPSMTRLAGMLSSHSSDSNLKSSSSSRTGSFTHSSSIPSWARLYYSRGEPRLLVPQPSADSMRSQYNGGQRNGSFLSRSPSVERFVMNIYSPRRRPRQTVPTASAAPANADTPNVADTPIVPDEPAASARRSSRPKRQISGRRSMEITAQHPIINVARGLKRKTSSIWSPHLGHDRRASGYSIWEPPSAVWSEDSGLTSRRNMQVVLFVAGFIFPFAWMIAAFLPLPPAPQLGMMERLRSTSRVDLRLEAAMHAVGIEESRYNSARWWRNLNRGMSVVGILVMGAVIALIVVGTRQQWG